MAGGGGAGQFVNPNSCQAIACSLVVPFRANIPPFVSRAQAILAILLAKAIAATLAGLRASSAVSHGGPDATAAAAPTLERFPC
jgi:hypothetical protein